VPDRGFKQDRVYSTYCTRQTEHSAEQHIRIAYVYCNYKACVEQDVSSLLAAIFKQLVQGRLSTVDHIEQLHHKHANRGTKPLLDELYSALRDVLAHHPTVYMVIDALDECQEGTRRQFLAKLRDLQAVRDIRVMATSRFIPDIEDAFREAPRLEVRASGEDIKRFVIGQTYRLPARMHTARHNAAGDGAGTYSLKSALFLPDTTVDLSLVQLVSRNVRRFYHASTKKGAKLWYSGCASWCCCCRGSYRTSHSHHPQRQKNNFV
jgi:hypothetical protein